MCIECSYIGQHISDSFIDWLLLLGKLSNQIFMLLTLHYSVKPWFWFSVGPNIFYHIIRDTRLWSVGIAVKILAEKYVNFVNQQNLWSFWHFCVLNSIIFAFKENFFGNFSDNAIVVNNILTELIEISAADCLANAYSFKQRQKRLKISFTQIIDAASAAHVKPI